MDEEKYSLPSAGSIQEELKRERSRRRFWKIIKNTISTLIIIAAIAVLIGDTVLSLLWSTPFSYVRNMGIEQKYGFNKMTKKTFVGDLVKETVISLGLMCGLICIIHGL